MHETLEIVNVNDAYAHQTPLEKLVGFKAAEQDYDLLNDREQIIIDLLICQWNQAQIAWLFGVSQPSIHSSVRRIRVKLANSTLYKHLVRRQEMKEGEHQKGGF